MTIKTIKGVLIVLFCMAFLIGCQPKEDTIYKNSITRVLSTATADQGETFKINYHISLDEGQGYYMFADDVPGEFEILDCEHDNANKIKAIEVQNAQSRVLECSIKAPSASGEYKFTGRHVVGMGNELIGIKGKDTITIR